MKKVINLAAYLSLAWGIVINAAVVLNLEFAGPLAAGGGYDNFPAGVRVVYFFQMLWIIYELRSFNRLVNGQVVRPKWIINVFIALSLIGFILNILSSSPAERWNAVGLAITAYAFYRNK